MCNFVRDLWITMPESFKTIISSRKTLKREKGESEYAENDCEIRIQRKVSPLFILLCHSSEHGFSI